MNKNIFKVIVFLTLALFLSNNSLLETKIVEAQSKKTLADFGLTSEDVKWLSKSEIENILNSKTPEETKKEIAKDPTSAPILPSVYDQKKITGNSDVVNCFDNYSFGSVHANLFISNSSVIAGSTLHIDGNIVNDNNYPIVDGILYIKIFKQRGNINDANGPDVIDQFIAVENINIARNKSVPISFDWKVPLYIRGGEYTIGTYFITSKKFNLSGLSFTDDVVGNMFDIKVLDGSKRSVFFDKAQVEINGTPYLFAAYPPRIDAKENAKIKAKILNETSEDQNIFVTWRLYKWDSMDSDNFISQTTESYKVKANSMLSIEKIVDDKNYPVYYLVGELKYKDTKSIISIRFVRTGIDRVRLNFPYVLDFPIENDKTFTVFSCAHNSGTSPIVPKNKLMIKVLDNNNSTVLNEYTYEGDITGDMMAVKKNMKSIKRLEDFYLSAELWQDGKKVDQASVHYDCNKIDNTLCTKLKSNNLAIASSIFALFFIVFLFGFYKRKIKSEMMIVFLIIITSLFSVPNTTHAKTTSWNQTFSDNLEYFWNNGGKDGSKSGWVSGLGSRNITVQYSADILYSDGSKVEDGATVPVGTILTLKFNPHRYKDISWFGTGYSSDSPYGQWRANAEPPPVPNGIVYIPGQPRLTGQVGSSAGAWCPNTVDDTLTYDELNKNYATFWSGLTADGNREFHDSITQRSRADLASFVGLFNYNNIFMFGVYVPLVISPPEKVITGVKDMSCGKLEGNENDGYSMQCKVNKSGSINPKFNFSATSGKYYYRYFSFYSYGYVDPVTKASGMCVGNNVPMRGENSTLLVPEKVIEYKINAVDVEKSNRPPENPTISGPAYGEAEQKYVFGIVSKDPDNDELRYGIDWNDDLLIDQWVPNSGAVNSGSLQNTDKSWVEIGSHSFNVIAQDSNGLLSGWSRHTINLGTKVLINTGDMVCDSISANPFSVSSGETSVLSWNSTGASSCTVSDGEKILFNAKSGKEVIKPANTTMYTLICRDESVIPTQICNKQTSLTVSGGASTATTIQNPVSSLSVDFPLWINGDKKLVDLKTRIGRSFGLNWDATNGIGENLIKNSCVGSAKDNISGNDVNMSGWSGVKLDDQRINKSFTISATSKGRFDLYVKCTANNGVSNESIFSNKAIINIVDADFKEN